MSSRIDPIENCEDADQAMQACMLLGWRWHTSETNPAELDVVLFDVDQAESFEDVLPGFEAVTSVSFVGHYRIGAPARSYQGKPAWEAITEFATRNLF